MSVPLHSSSHLYAYVSLYYTGFSYGGVHHIHMLSESDTKLSRNYTRSPVLSCGNHIGCALISTFQGGSDRSQVLLSHGKWITGTRFLHTNGMLQIMELVTNDRGLVDMDNTLLPPVSHGSQTSTVQSRPLVVSRCCAMKRGFLPTLVCY